MNLLAKAKFFYKNILNGLLGIWAEIVAVSLFIIMGFLVCFFWWRILVK